MTRSIRNKGKKGFLTSLLPKEQILPSSVQHRLDSSVDTIPYFVISIQPQPPTYHSSHATLLYVITTKQLLHPMRKIQTTPNKANRRGNPARFSKMTVNQDMENRFRRRMTNGTGSLNLYSPLQKVIGSRKDIRHCSPKEVFDFYRDREMP